MTPDQYQAVIEQQEIVIGSLLLYSTAFTAFIFGAWAQCHRTAYYLKQQARPARASAHTSATSNELALERVRQPPTEFHSGVFPATNGPLRGA